MLRVAQENDIPQLLVIENLAQIAPWTAEVFDRCWQAGYLGWVIEENAEVIGFIIASFQAGEAHILNLCVHPRCQRRGYGRQLIEHVLSVAKSRGNGIVFLEVRRFNVNAIALYKKMHFVQIGERKNYYPAKEGREDALVFAIDTGAFNE